MLQIAPGWQMDIWEVDTWTCVRVITPEPTALDSPPLAEQVWNALDRRGSNLLILDLAQLPMLYSQLVGQLVLLLKRLSASGGMLRLCGLSARNREVLHLCRLDGRFSQYQSVDDALANRRD